MAADTAKLIASLELKDQFSGPLNSANKALGRFDAKLTASGSRGLKAGQQIGTGIKNAATIAVAGLGALTGLLLLSAKEGQEAAKVQNLYAAAIANSGKVNAAQVTVLNAQQTAIMNLTGADDELIKSEQTRLIQMGLHGDAIAKLTPLIADVVAATGKDEMSVTVAVGKAVAGNATALTKLGIILPKTTKAQAAASTEASRLATITGALTKGFGGAAAAISGGLDVRLKVLDQALSNLRESAGQKLLPALTRIVSVVATRLVPAFGKFIDQILPPALAGLDKLAGFLEGGGATSAIDSFLATAKAVMPVIQRSAEITGTVIKTAVDMFRSLPPEIQALAVAGLAINKLTGGLVTNIAGGLISAVISSFKGMMNVNAAVVNVNGAVGGVPGGSGLLPGAAAAGGGGLLATAGALVIPVTIAAISIAAAGALADAIDPSARAPGTTPLGQRDPKRFGPNGQIVRNSLPIPVVGSPNGLEDRPTAATSSASRYLGSEVRTVGANIDRMKGDLGRRAAAAQRAIVSAIQRQDLTANVNVRTTLNINGRWFDAANSRFKTTVGSSYGGGRDPFA